MSDESARAFWRRDCDKTESHEPHRVEHRPHDIEPTCDNADHAVCHGEHRVWCYGVIAPDSLRAKVEALQPGQRVRVVMEGVVEEERQYGSGAEWSACSINANNDMLVLRYTGKHPGTADHDDADMIRGRLVGPLVDVEVIP